MIQDTSLQAYESIQNKLGKKQEQVYLILKQIQPANNRQIAEHLNLPINTVTPRVKELRDKKLVGVADTGLDNKTGRPTIFWKCVK